MSKELAYRDTVLPRVKGLNLSHQQMEALRPFAHYIWWKNEEHTMHRPDLLIGQVMNIGHYEDVCRLKDLVGEKVLLYVLQTADPGQFNLPSWTYWHYRLTDIAPGQVPPLPTRSFV